MDAKTAAMLAAILLWLFGAFNLLAVAIVGVVPQAIDGMTPGQASVPLIVSGLLFIIAGFGLWLRQKWGRTLSIVVVTLAVLAAVITFAADFFSGALDGTGTTRWYWWVDFFTLTLYVALLWLVAFYAPLKKAFQTRRTR